MLYILLLISFSNFSCFLIGLIRGKLGFYWKLGKLSMLNYSYWGGRELYIKGIPITILFGVISLYLIFSINESEYHPIATFLTLIAAFILGFWLLSITPQGYEEEQKSYLRSFSRLPKLLIATIFGFILFCFLIFGVTYLNDYLLQEKNFNIYKIADDFWKSLNF